MDLKLQPYLKHVQRSYAESSASELVYQYRFLSRKCTLTRARQQLLQSLPAVSNPTLSISNETWEELSRNQTSSLRCSPPPDIHLAPPPIAPSVQGSIAAIRISSGCWNPCTPFRGPSGACRKRGSSAEGSTPRPPVQPKYTFHDFSFS